MLIDNDLESFDLERGILGFDRDLFLCVIQFLNTASGGASA
jgi:hypothetical protein